MSSPAKNSSSASLVYPLESALLKVMKYVFAKYGPSEQAASNSSKEDLLEYYVHQPTRDPAASRSLDTNSSLEPNKE